MMPQQWIFLDHDGLRHVRSLRKEGRLDEAETLLKKAEPSQAVLDELRKVASQRASIAKKANDWASVIAHLEQIYSICPAMALVLYKNGECRTSASLRKR